MLWDVFFSLFENFDCILSTCSRDELCKIANPSSKSLSFNKTYLKKKKNIFDV